MSFFVHHRPLPPTSLSLPHLSPPFPTFPLLVSPFLPQVFEMNPVEYIRRDAEGSDSDTRRRAAADLVRALTDRFPAQVTATLTGYVQVGGRAWEEEDSEGLRWACVCVGGQWKGAGLRRTSVEGGVLHLNGVWEGRQGRVRQRLRVSPHA